MSTIRSWVRELCVRKLAQQIYERINCDSKARASIDWYTAVSHVVSVPSEVDRIATEFIGKLANEQLADTLPATLVLSYEAFERLCGWTVWDRMFQAAKKWCVRYPYTSIRYGG